MFEDAFAKQVVNLSVSFKRNPDADDIGIDYRFGLREFGDLVDQIFLGSLLSPSEAPFCSSGYRESFAIFEHHCLKTLSQKRSSI